MKKGKWIVLGLALCGAWINAMAQDSVFKFSGKVTDAEGRGIAGVVVNDGIRFTKTDRQGAWTLTCDTVTSKFVSISTPAAYCLPQQEGLADGFYVSVRRLAKEGGKHNFVLEKRKNAVLCSEIEFQRNGKPDKAVNEQIRSPWFNRLVGDIIDAKFWGFTLCQFYKEGEWADYDLIPRKHVDPIKKLILRHQTDITGLPWDNYTDLLFVGSPDDLGLLAKAAPWVICKRNTTGDWSQFSEVFGMPIQEYIYDSDDEESRQRAMEDAANAGSLAQFFHAKDTEFKLTEAGNKTGSADVYEHLCERCNNEISKLVLGNTLTTESSENGTQALGTVHKKVEDKVAQADKRYVLDVLNYDMADIFARIGINTAGGEFCFPEKKDIDPTPVRGVRH